MDESAQQAVQLGLNVTIFVIALSLAISLIVGVRDVADKALEYDASIPTGSRVLSVDEARTRKIKGYELLSYYANYMTDINSERTGRYRITIENTDGSEKILEQSYTTPIDIDDLKDYIEDENINLRSEYEVVIDTYDKENNVLSIVLKEI